VRIVGTKEIELKHIKPLFPREVDEGELEELAKSVEAVGGVVHPVVVRPSKEEGFYDLICGYRRYLALRKLGLTVVEAVVVECDDREAFQLSLIENLQRVDLSDYEVAKRLRELRDRFNLTPTQIAQLLGKSRAWVENHLRMLELEKEVAKVLESRPTVSRETVGRVMDKLTEKHARAILEQPEPVRGRLVEEVVEKIIEGEEPPSARTLERRAKELIKLGEEATAEAVQAPRPSPPSAEVELKAEEPEEEPKVIYSRVVRGAEDIHKAFDELKQVLERGVAPTAPTAVETVEARATAPPPAPVEKEIPERTAVVAERPTPSAEEAVSAINDLLLQLNDVLERLRLSATSLVGRRIRAVFEHPYEEGEEEEAVGTLVRADRKAVYVEVALGGGAKAERMVRWYELRRMELA
jgi:ParB family chromosome partitioning protein